MHIFHKWRLVKISKMWEDRGDNYKNHLIAGKGYQCDQCQKRKYKMMSGAPFVSHKEMMEWTNKMEGV